MIDALATHYHLVEHLEPIWWALPEEERGTFWVGSKPSGLGTRTGTAGHGRVPRPARPPGPNNHYRGLGWKARYEWSTDRAALNPLFVEWLMGFPLGWTDLEG